MKNAIKGPVNLAKRPLKSLILLLLCLQLFPGPALAAGASYKLSMLPRYYPEKIKAMITPLAEYLSQKTGNRITPVLTDDFKDYEERLKSGDIQIGYENPLVYTKVSGTHEALAMAIKGEGKDRFRGIVITRPDSGIQVLQDLRHKKIMIVGKTSAGGFLSQKLSLSPLGIAVEQDCDLEEASANRQENVIIAVSIGDADAGFIRESAFHSADPYIRPGSVKVVAPCTFLPNWALSVSRELPQTVKAEIRAAILALSKDDPAIAALQITGFRQAEDPDYDVIRTLKMN